MKRLFHDAVVPGTGWPGDLANSDTPIAPLDGPPENLADTSASVTDLSARISVCRTCPRLVAWREQVARDKRRSFASETYWGRPAPGFGDDTPGGLAVVGLAPAAHGANRTGRVFTGDRTGDFLVAAMHRAGFANQPTSTHAGDGLELTGARLLSAVRCAPPENRPTPTERRNCAPWLDRELQFLRPRVLLALGGIGWQAVCVSLAGQGWQIPKPRPKFGHGASFVARRDEEEITILGCYHPSQQNTFTGLLTQEMMDAIFARCRTLIAVR